MSEIQNDSADVAEQITGAQPDAESQSTEVQSEHQPLTLREAVERSFEKHSTVSTQEQSKAGTAPQEPAEVNAIPEASTKATDPITGRELEPINAPAGMPPGVREGWSKIDRRTQQYWVDREKDIQTRLNQTAEERKLATEFRDAAAPYEALLRQHNLTAVGYTKDLLKFSHTLQTGTPQVRAQMIAGMIQQYQPDAATLQAVLSGQQQVQQQAPVNVQEELKKASDAREAAQREAEANKTIESTAQAFMNDPANEFASDVRLQMKSILEAGLVPDGDDLTMFKNAYVLACQSNPDVKAVLDQRAAAAATRQNAPTSVQTLKAVPSVKPSLNNGTRSAVPARKLSVREAAELAFDRHVNKQ